MWLQISSGNGPIECMRFTARFLEVIQKEAKEKNFKFELIDCAEGDGKDTFKSVLISLEGENVREYVSQVEGTHLWLWNSLYRPKHKRKNWFIEVQAIEDLVYTHTQDEQIDPKEIIIEKMRSSGKGGQHVNKVESAVRVTHIKTGIMVIAREERSQHANIRLAKARLVLKLREHGQDKEKSHRQQRWQEGMHIVRGNAKRIFKGDSFKEDID